MITKNLKVKKNSKNKNILVMKFGGASIATGERMLHVAKVIKKYRRKYEVIVIVSALQGMTDKLITLFQLYKTGKMAEGINVVEILHQMHKSVLNELKLNKNDYRYVESSVSALFQKLRNYLTYLNDFSLLHYDNVISFGERLSSCLVAASLKKYSIKARSVDSSKIIVANNAFGNARVLLVETKVKTRKLIFSLLSKKIIPVITGFFAGTKKGIIVTLGRGGSDYSATVLANVLDAREVILWKEVDGVFGEDPKKNRKAKLFLRLSYKQAMNLARKGAKVLHPEAIKPAAAKGIIVWVRNIFRPDFVGTKIC